MPLEEDWQRADLPRAVTLSILRWPKQPVAADGAARRR